MNEALTDAQADHRAAVTRVFVRLLATRPEAERHRLMEAMAAALARLPEGVRVRRMADMMAAVAQLPPEPRRSFMATMVSFRYRHRVGGRYCRSGAGGPVGSGPKLIPGTLPGGLPFPLVLAKRSRKRMRLSRGR